MKKNQIWVLVLAFSISGYFIAQTQATQSSVQTIVKDLPWRLVYAHDAQGKPKKGDKQHLINAIRQGYPVRVGWGAQWSRKGKVMKVEHVTDAKFLSVYENEVFAQIEPIIRQRPFVAEPGVQLDSLQLRTWRAVFGTTGVVRSVGRGFKGSRDRRSVYWFAKADTESLHTSTITNLAE